MFDNDKISFIEEKNVGLNHMPVLFESTNKYFFTLSEKNVFVYEIETGEYYKVLKHLEQVIALHYINKKLFSFTKNGTIIEWDLDNCVEISKTVLATDLNFLWTYEVSNENFDANKDIYIFAQQIPYLNGNSNLKNIEENLSNGSILFQLIIDNTNNTILLKLKRVIEIFEKITSKSQLAVAFDLAVLIIDCNLKIIPFFPNKSLIDGPLSFTHQTKISTFDNKKIAFDGVKIVKNSIYVSINFGRLYYWNCIRKKGLGSINKSFINVRDCSFVFEILNNQTLISGDGNGTLIKWNLSTSGGGRWHSAEYLEFEAPVERLLISDDSTYAAVILLDNSLYFIRTSTLTIQSKAKVLNWHFIISPLEWSKLTVDLANPTLVVTNARLGHIQWFDPAKWKTIATYDICEENPPHKDHFNLVNYLWLNVYLTHLTSSYLVTCECRRNDLNRTCTKIFYRNKPGSITDFCLEECIVSLKKILFICSNYDEIFLNTNKELFTPHEFVRIDFDGQIDVIVGDSRRKKRWRIDNNRSNITWRKSKIISCSRVRQDVFATVNEIDENSIKQRFVILWQLPIVLRVFQIIECFNDAKYVEWAPPIENEKSILLIVCDSKIVGYDPKVASVLWITNQSGFSLFSSLYYCFVYDDKRIVWFDPLTGKLKKIQQFSHTQKQIIATGIHSNVCISGLSKNGLSVLKKDLVENAILSDISTKFKKKTPFSELINGFVNESDLLKSDKNLFVNLQPKTPLASKIFDAPAYSLPSTSIIAPQYIQACLIPRKNSNNY